MGVPQSCPGGPPELALKIEVFKPVLKALKIEVFEPVLKNWFVR